MEVQETEDCPRSSKRLKPSDVEEIPSVEEVYEKDLPLLSNVGQVHVSHYVFNLEFSPQERTVKGQGILFLEEVNEDEKGMKGKEIKNIVLDACALHVTRVGKVTVVGMDLQNLEELYSVFEKEDGLNSLNFMDLNFSVDKWSLDIWGWEGSEVPEAVMIEYETLPDTPSLHWRPSRGFSFEGDVPICCYTPAAPVNNRGLFPCQEPPSAMATWQCFVKVRKPYRAFLSSDNPGRTIVDADDWAVRYYNCSQSLPMSTFSVIVSIFEDKNIFEGDWTFEDESGGRIVVPVRWIFQCDVEETFGWESVNFTKSLLTESCRILGPLPFQRLDVILMPNCFPTLGLANPSMIFLSPSLMIGKRPLLFHRIAHEVGHFWFGLSIGALDWTEEWLSEGFATFIEDVICKKILQNSMNTDFGVSLQEVNIRPLMRLITLQHELESTSSREDLHYLQPNQVLDCDGVKTENLVINGMEPLKEFMQVHYLKGYFCLKLLSDLVAEEQFLKFLRQYVLKFKGQLVRSEDFLGEFKNYCENINAQNSVQIDSISQEWLRTSKLPEPYSSLNLITSDLFAPEEFQRLFPDCVESFARINAFSISFLNQEPSKNKNVDLNSTEKLIVLEQILSSSRKLNEEDFHRLKVLIMPEDENPEVLHRWCELIVKFRCKKKIEAVRHFLLNHPAMGIYLYGELMISERSFQVLARKLYKLRREVLDPPHLQVLRRMIF